MQYMHCPETRLYSTSSQADSCQYSYKLTSSGSIYDYASTVTMAMDAYNLISKKGYALVKIFIIHFLFLNTVDGNA